MNMEISKNLEAQLSVEAGRARGAAEGEAEQVPFASRAESASKAAEALCAATRQAPVRQQPAEPEGLEVADTCADASNRIPKLICNLNYGDSRIVTAVLPVVVA
jgi:hypothetical protein